MHKDTKVALDRYCIKKYRFEQNPLEQAYAEAWMDLSTSHGMDLYPNAMLKHLMSADGREANVTDRDIEVATAVVQWLGSPVGQSFVKKVLEGERV